MTIKILKNSKDPKILIITPLLTGHKISKKTKQTLLKGNETPFVWISYEGPGKHAENVQAGLNEYKKIFKKFPEFIQILDRDISLGRHMIDKLYSCLTRELLESDKKIAFAYCPFAYKGYINATFPPREYDIKTLLRGNYISSNSLYFSDAIEEVGGFVTELKYHRLSDWAMWIKLLRYGYQGKLCQNTSFVAKSSKDDISAGGEKEYSETYNLIQKDFIEPLNNFLTLS